MRAGGGSTGFSTVDRCVVVESWYHTQTRRERETLGRAWNEENRCTANRARDRGAILSVFILKPVFFFFLPSQSSFSSPPPPFSVTALKGSMFILKDIRRHERTHTLTCTCMWLLMYTSEWAQTLSSLHKNRNQTNNSLKSKSRLFEPFSAEARSRLSFLWSNSRLVKHLLSRSKVEKSWISCRDERWLSY